MTGSFSIDPAVVDTVMSSMKARTANVRRWLWDLEAESRRTLDTWDGQAKTAYADAQHKWNLAADEAAAMLDVRTDKLAAINDGYVQADGKVANLLSI